MPRKIVGQQNLSSDTFTRADSASNLGSTTQGQAWTVDGGGAYGITSNKAIINTVSGTDNAAVIDAGIGDYSTLSVDVGMVTNANCGLCFRYTDISNFLVVRFLQSGGSVALFKKTGGTLTSLASASVTLTNGVSYNLKIIAQGINIKVLVDGVLLINHNLSAADQGSFPNTITKVGLRNGGGSAGSVTYDNFVCKSTDTVESRTPISVIGVGISALLLESGFHLLLESGYNLLT